MKRLMPLAALALCVASAARAAETAPLAALLKDAEVLVVGEVTRVEVVPGAALPAQYAGTPVTRLRAVARVFRGIKTADDTSYQPETVAFEYFGISPEVLANGPANATLHLPELAADQIVLLPLKRSGPAWELIADRDEVVMPAVEQVLTIDAPDARTMVARELAGACALGDFVAAGRAGRFLSTLDKTADAAIPDAIFAMIQHEIGATTLREDVRWVQIAGAVYCYTPAPRPGLRDLLTGALPDSPPLRLAALLERRAGRSTLDQRMVMLLVRHQEDPGAAWGIATAIGDNYPTDSLMLSMETQLFPDGTPGALMVASYLCRDGRSALAGPALSGARKALTRDARADRAKGVAIAPAMRVAVPLLLRLGSDEDLQYVLDQIADARKHDPDSYQGFLELADPALPPARIAAICRIYINDPTSLKSPASPSGDLRLCDLAAATVARLAKQDFGGTSPAATPAQREAAVEKARAWLNSQP